MTSAISSASSAQSAWLKRQITKLDTDGDGNVSKTEFTTGASSANLSSDAAATLFDTLDSSSSGSLAISDLASAFQTLSSDTRAALMQTQEMGTPPSAEDIFAKIDTDGDGMITESEFADGRPSNMSAEQASSLFSQMSGDSDSLSKEQFLANAPKPPQGGHGGPGGPGGKPPSAEDLFSKLDSDGDGTVTSEEFIAGRPEDVSEEQAANLWQMIASGADSMSQTDFVAAMTPPDHEAVAAASASGESASATSAASSATASLSFSYDTTAALQQMMADLKEALDELSQHMTEQSDAA